MSIASYKPRQNFIAVQWDGTKETKRHISVTLPAPYRLGDWDFAESQKGITILRGSGYHSPVHVGDWVVTLYGEVWTYRDEEFKSRFELISAQAPAMPASLIEGFKSPSRIVDKVPGEMFFGKGPISPAPSLVTPRPWKIFKLPNSCEHVIAVKWDGTNIGEINHFLESRECATAGLFPGILQISIGDSIKAITEKQADELDQLYLEPGWWLIRCKGELSVLDLIQIKRCELVGEDIHVGPVELMGGPK